MPNLISINLTSLLQDTELIKEYKTNQIDTTLNNVTTVYCDWKLINDLKEWFIYILPNVKRLVLFYSQLAIINFNLNTLYSALSGLDSGSQCVTTDYACFSNIKDMDIKFVLGFGDDLGEQMSGPIKEILKIFENSKTFIFHFYRNGSYSSNKLYQCMSKMITLLNMDKNFENYHMKHDYNYLQLIKKNNG
jgi:hypothetical protein